MSNLETKILKKKNIDKELIVKVLRNTASERIFVEFASKDGKLKVHKSFQDNYYGREDAKKFESSIGSIEDLRNYFNSKRIKGEQNVT